MGTESNSDATSRDAALALLGAGLTPLPTRPGEKRPAINWKEFATRRPTRDEVEAWYTTDGRRGVALMMGQGLLAVDVDVHKGGDPAPFQGTTPCVQRTPNGGYHFVYTLKDSPDNVRPRAGVRPGIDIRTKESIIVLAPTRIPAADGEWRAYEFEDGGFEALLKGDLPNAIDVPTVRALLAGEAAAGGGESATDGRHEERELWIAETLANPEKILPGFQEPIVRDLAFYLAKHHDEDIAFAILRGWANRLPLGNIHRPWTDQDLLGKLTSAYKKLALNPDAGHVAPTVKDSRPAAEKFLEFIDIDALAQRVRDIGRRPWLVPGWLRARGLFLIAGASHFGKTWLSIDLAVSTAIGGKFLNAYPVDAGGKEGDTEAQPADPGGGRRVLYIVGEDDAPDFMERLYLVLAAKDAHPRSYFVKTTNEEEVDRIVTALKQGDDAKLAACDADLVARVRQARDACLAAGARHKAFKRNFLVHIDRQFTFGNKNAQDALLDRVQEFKPSLVIFDPLKDMVPGEDVEGFFSRVVEYTRFLRDLRDAADCCVGIVHHTHKKLEWEKPDAGISGRTEFIASFEHRFVCFRAPAAEDEDDECAAFHWTQGVIQRRLKSSAPLDPVAIKYAGLSEQLVLHAEEVSEEEGKARVEGKSRSEELEPRVLAIIETSAPISARAVHSQLQTDGGQVARKTVQETLRRLEDTGRITKAGKDGYAPAGWSPGPHGSGPQAREGTTTPG